MTNKNALVRYMPKLVRESLEALNDGSQEQAQRKKPLRLSIITQFYPPDYAATGQLLSELATHLGKLGMHVHFFYWTTWICF